MSLSNKDQELSILLSVLGKPEKKILGLWRYGSWVYGTNDADSDKDFVVLLPRVKNPWNVVEYEANGTKYSFVPHDETSFQRGLWAHEPAIVETFFLPEEHVVKPCEKTWDFAGVDKRILRIAFSQKASHSYVKAKKKLVVEKDNRRGKKSLFHSLRIIDFGIQLAKYGKIQDFKSKVDVWNDIWLNFPDNDWEGLEKKYRPVYNGLSTAFREVCPK